MALLIMVAWGLQAYFIKLANATMSAESIFAYMMITGLMFIPVACALTDFSKPIYLGFAGPWLAVKPVLMIRGPACVVPSAPATPGWRTPTKAGRSAAFSFVQSGPAHCRPLSQPGTLAQSTAPFVQPDAGLTRPHEPC
jgi:hypothetical protein